MAEKEIDQKLLDYLAALSKESDNKSSYSKDEVAITKALTFAPEAIVPLYKLITGTKDIGCCGTAAMLSSICRRSRGLKN